MSGTTDSYEDGLRAALLDPHEAAAYLSAALEDNDPQVFLLALRDVSKAHGIAAVAKAARLNREHLYRILSRDGNPQLSSLNALLHSLGLRLAVEVISTSRVSPEPSTDESATSSDPDG